MFKSQKLSKSQESAKSKKELSKSWNLSKFDAKENAPSFFTPNTKTAFNYLWLAFTKALIFQYFDAECHIRIKTDVSSYSISGVLS